MKTNKHIEHTNNTQINFKTLLDLCAGEDTMFMIELVDMFIESIEKIMMQLEVACKEKNVAVVYETAHKAKSSLSIIQISSMWVKMDQLETEANNGLWSPHWMKIIEQLKNSWVQIIPFLENWKRTITPNVQVPEPI